MEFVRFLILTCCAVVSVDCERTSQLAKKVDALENLFWSKMYLVNQAVESSQQEREKIVEQLNELNWTMENVETLKNEGKTVTNVDERPGDQGILKDKIEELSDSLLRIKRGVQEEKVARKNETNTVLQQLEEMLKNHLEMVTKNNLLVINNQNNLFSKIEELTTVQGDLINKVNTLETTLDMHQDEVVNSNEIIQTQLTEVKSTTQDLKSSIIGVGVQLQNVEENTAQILYCNNQLDLDDCLEKYFTEQQHFITEMHQPVSLVGGNTSKEGRVEVKYKGRQGTVCDDDWDDNDAEVVCRMLGYSGGTALQGTHSRFSGGGGKPHHSFGQGTGEILLDNVHCTGSEKSLLDCEHAGIGVDDCDHMEDAGVRCNP